MNFQLGFRKHLLGSRAINRPTYTMSFGFERSQCRPLDNWRPGQEMELASLQKMITSSDNSKSFMSESPLSYPNTQLFASSKDAETEVNTSPKLPSHQQFLPVEVDAIPKEGKDLLMRLLEMNPKFRLKSVLGLRRIAMFKDFDINVETLKEISPLELMHRANVTSVEVYTPYNNSSAIETSAFRDF